MKPDTELGHWLPRIWAETSPNYENPLNYCSIVCVYLHRKRGCDVSQFLKGIYKKEAESFLDFCFDPKFSDLFCSRNDFCD